MIDKLSHTPISSSFRDYVLQAVLCETVNQLTTQGIDRSASGRILKSLTQTSACARSKMSFQVNFGSDTNLHQNSTSRRGQPAAQHTADAGSSREAQQRGSGGRGRGRGARRPEGRRPSYADEDENSDTGEDSDDASSVSSENPIYQRRQRGRSRGQGRGGRGGYPRSSRGRERDFRQSRGSTSDLRSPPEQAPSDVPQQKEIHVYYHAMPPAGGGPAPLLPHNMYDPSQLLAPQPGYPYGLPAPLLHAAPLGHGQQPYPSGLMQAHQQAYPLQHQQNQSQPGFNPANPTQLNQPGFKPPLLNNPRPLFPPGSRYNNQRVNQQSSQKSAPKWQADKPLTSATGATRGSAPSLNQKFSGQRNDRDVRPKQRDEGRKGQKPEVKQSDGKPSRKKEQEQLSGKNNDEQDVPDLSPDEWMDIFDVLIKKFKGRTKLGTLLSQKGNLFKGLSHSQAEAFLKHSNRFLTFEKDGKIKFVSVFYRGARVCFKYRKHNTDKCQNETCPFYHICRDFVSGHCPRQSRCHFNHSFLRKSNAIVTTEAGLQDFTDEDITTIVLRSTPVVCDKFNKGKCKGDCLDLHVCAEFIKNRCSDENCTLGHQIKGTEQNDWVLETFSLDRVYEQTLCKMVITVNEEVEQNHETKRPSASATKEECFDSQQYQDKTHKLGWFRSRESMSSASELSLPDGAKQDIRSSADTGQQSRKTGGREKDAGSNFVFPPNLTLCDEVEEEKQISVESSMASDQRGRQHTSERFRDPVVLKGVKTSASLEGREGQTEVSANDYTHLCENHTWEGTCPKSYLCHRYHHPLKLPFVWQLHISGEWRDFSEQDSDAMERRFCDLRSQVTLQVILEYMGGMELSFDFSKMTAEVTASFGNTGVETGQALRVRRWSTPSYVEWDAGTPFQYYTQWIWYHPNGRGDYKPFSHGTLQYTLEEKHASGQQKYYFEAGEQSFIVDLQDMKQMDLSQRNSVPVLRRPFFFERDTRTAAPVLSSALLSDPPRMRYSNLPSHWSRVDCSQDFERVELRTASSEYLDVEKSFHSSLSRDRFSILHIFRVQNPSLWDKYCSNKRAMIPWGSIAEDVDERKLFHGTPALPAVRGICANNIDFRRAGENTGALFGKGSYFSTNAVYSHRFTKGPECYMFLAKVLVGKFTQGEKSYTSPPVRDGLKRYDSCVDDVANPSIFVIFDLAQSYPEYLIQYVDAEMGQGKVTPSAHAPTTLSGSDSARSGAKPTPRPRASVPPAVPKTASTKKEGTGEQVFSVQQLRKRFE